MKRMALILLMAIGLASLPGSGMAGDGCTAGGPGESSCSYISKTTLLGFTLWEIERSVSGCPEGTYACCKLLGSGCKKM